MRFIVVVKKVKCRGPISFGEASGRLEIVDVDRGQHLWIILVGQGIGCRQQRAHEKKLDKWNFAHKRLSQDRCSRRHVGMHPNKIGRQDRVGGFPFLLSQLSQGTTSHVYKHIYIHTYRYVAMYVGRYV